MEFGSSQFTNLIAYVSLLVSGVLAIFYIRDRRNARFSIENEYSNQLLGWHAAVIDVLVRLRGSYSADSVQERRGLLLQLSSLIEQGRFYFPNIKPGEYGAEKPPAYRGYRNVALDFLVASYNLHHKPISDKTDKQAEYLQRLFTSVVFEVVRPSERLKVIQDLTNRYFVKDVSVEDLEENDQLEAVSHMWDSPN